MPQPRLRVRQSGMGGSGYVLPARPGDPFKEVKNADGQPVKARLDANGNTTVLPGVTTVLKGYGQPGGLIQFAVDQTAAYAVANIDALLNRTEQEGWGFLRFFHSREPDFDNPDMDIRSYHVGVLNDLAELGTLVHEWVEANVKGEFEPEITRREHAEMVEQWLTFRSEHEVVSLAAELSVFNLGAGYAGTLDHIWSVDGVTQLTDVKTSRQTRDVHRAQVAALDRADLAFVEREDGFWDEVDIPAYSRCSVLQLRPDDWDNKGNPIPAFCKLEEVTDLDLHYRGFMCMLEQRNVERELKMVRKGRGE